MSKRHLLSELSGADYVTALATLLIVCAFWLLWRGQIFAAIGVAFFSMFCDYLDGTIARRFGSSDYGSVYDSLYDILGWVLFPALVINIKSGWSVLSVIVTTIFCVAALIRLGRFTVKGYVKDGSRYYTGLPVLFSKYALFLSFVWHGLLAVAFLAVMIPLMVSNRLIRKPHAFWAQLELIYGLTFLGLYWFHV